MKDTLRHLIGNRVFYLLYSHTLEDVDSKRIYPPLRVPDLRECPCAVCEKDDLGIATIIIDQEFLYRSITIELGAILTMQSWCIRHNNTIEKL